MADSPKEQPKEQAKELPQKPRRVGILRARANKSTSTEVADRIEHLRGLMARNEYRTHITVTELAKVWGVSPVTVGGYASAAARSFKLSPEAREELRARMAMAFEALAARAAAELSQVTGLSDLRTAGDLLERAAKYSGVNLDEEASRATAEPYRVVVVMSDGDKEPEPGPQ